MTGDEEGIIGGEQKLTGEDGHTEQQKRIEHPLRLEGTAAEADKEITGLGEGREYRGSVEYRERVHYLRTREPELRLEEQCIRLRVKYHRLITWNLVTHEELTEIIQARILTEAWTVSEVERYLSQEYCSTLDQLIEDRNREGKDRVKILDLQIQKVEADKALVDAQRKLEESREKRKRAPFHSTGEREERLVEEEGTDSPPYTRPRPTLPESCASTTGPPEATTATAASEESESEEEQEDSEEEESPEPSRQIIVEVGQELDRDHRWPYYSKVREDFIQLLIPNKYSRNLVQKNYSLLSSIIEVIQLRSQIQEWYQHRYDEEGQLDNYRDLNEQEQAQVDFAFDKQVEEEYCKNFLISKSEAIDYHLPINHPRAKNTVQSYRLDSLISKLQLVSADFDKAVGKAKEGEFESIAAIAEGYLALRLIIEKDLPLSTLVSKLETTLKQCYLCFLVVYDRNHRSYTHKIDLTGIFPEILKKFKAENILGNNRIVDLAYRLVSEGHSIEELFVEFTTFIGLDEFESTGSWIRGEAAKNSRYSHQFLLPGRLYNITVTERGLIAAIEDLAARPGSNRRVINIDGLADQQFRARSAQNVTICFFPPTFNQKTGSSKPAKTTTGSSSSSVTHGESSNLRRTSPPRRSQETQESTSRREDRDRRLSRFTDNPTGLGGSSNRSRSGSRSSNTRTDINRGRRNSRSRERGSDTAPSNRTYNSERDKDRR